MKAQSHVKLSKALKLFHPHETPLASIFREATRLEWREVDTTDKYFQQGSSYAL
jgi:hypothetical protein